MSEPLTRHDVIRIGQTLVACLLIVVIFVMMVFGPFHLGSGGVDTYQVHIEYHPTNRGSVTIETESVAIEGMLFPIRITGLFLDVNYSLWSDPCMSIGPYTTFTNRSEITFWFQILVDDQQWILTREYLNQTVLVARIYLP